MSERIGVMYDRGDSDYIPAACDMDRLMEEYKAKGEKDLPTIDQFIGSDPDFTGGMSTKEYIDHMRGTEP